MIFLDRADVFRGLQRIATLCKLMRPWCFVSKISNYSSDTSTASRIGGGDATPPRGEAAAVRAAGSKATGVADGSRRNR